MKILIIDNYDSFTYNLRDYFYRLGLEVLVVRNDAFSEPKDLPQAQALVLAPGPSRPENAGLLMPTLNYFLHRLPILGVCLGHQAIGLHFGAKLVRAKIPMHGKTSNLQHTKTDIFSPFDQDFVAMRYHSLVLENLPTCLATLAWTKEDNTIMALRHQTLPIWGLQFHPESIGTTQGLTLLKTWIQAL